MIREEIAKRLHTWERNILKIIYEASPMNVSWSALTEAQREKFRKDAEQILSIKGIRIEVDNQDLPENEDIPKEFNELACGAEDDSDNVARACYLLAQQDMLTPKDGKVWKRVIDKGIKMPTGYTEEEIADIRHNACDDTVG